MNIQNISTVPPHLGKFLNKNHEKLNEIYENSIKEQGDGLLSFKCVESENKIDVFFMAEPVILQNFPKESWESLKVQRGDKKIYLIEDLEKSNMFIVYI